MILTRYSSAASLMGTHLCFVCVFESRQITQMGCWSTWQKSLNFSPCNKQISLDPALFLLSCFSEWDRFLRARFWGSWVKWNISLQTGHVLSELCLHHSCKQCWQKLWPHSNRTGSVNMSQHTGHVHSASDCGTFEAILLISASSLFSLVDLLSLLRLTCIWQKRFWKLKVDKLS